jgi:DNA-binding transcriptional MerR regulator
MEEVKEKEEYTLSEIQKLLKTEQHRLIHLCEKGVITPDFEDSSGRGTMRRFSERNLFEFAVALELRRFYLPLTYISPIIKVLRAFEGYAAKKLDLFSLPRSLQNQSAVGLRLIIGEGKDLYFALREKRKTVYIGSLDLSSKIPRRLNTLKSSTTNPTENNRSRLELDLNKVATSYK